MILRESCTRCNLCINNNNTPIHPVGNLETAKIFVLLSDVKRNDLKEMKLSFSKDMRTLQEYLRIIGFNEEDIYWSNLIKCYIPYRSEENASLICLDYINHELSQFKTGILIIVGIRACKVVFGERFNPYDKLGKIITTKDNRLAILTLPGLTKVFNDRDNSLLFQSSLSQLFEHYKNNIDYGHHSPFAKYKGTHNSMG